MRLSNRLVPTENYLLSITLPAAIVLPVVWFLFFIYPAAIWLQFWLPAALGFLSVAFFGGTSVWRLLLVDLSAVVFYIFASYAVAIIYSMFTSEADFAGFDPRQAVGFFLIWAVMIGVCAFPISLFASVFGHIFARAIGRDVTDL